MSTGQKKLQSEISDIQNRVSDLQNEPSNDSEEVYRQALIAISKKILESRIKSRNSKIGEATL